MKIEERLARRSPEDVIYLGELVENFLNTDCGALLTVLLNSRVSMELEKSLRSNISADRVLGRCEMANILMGDFEQFVIDKQKMSEPIETKKASDETVLAKEPGV